MVVETFNPPTRSQLARVAQGDERLLRAFEELFRSAGRSVPDELEELESDVAGLLAAPKDGAVLRAQIQSLALRLDDADLTPNPLTRSTANLQQKQRVIRSLETGELVFVSDKYDFPAAVSGVITLADKVTYYLTSDVDLDGDRIVGGQSSVIIGPSSENATLSSTGLTAALITSEWSLPMRFITLSATKILALDASANADQALDWFGVNFASTTDVGEIKGYSNVIITGTAFLSASGLTFDGTIGTVSFDKTLFLSASTGTSITIASTATITRRFRVIYSAVVTASSATAFNVSASATVPVEGYILDTVDFSGSGTFIAGVQHDDNKSLFVNNKGISNSAQVSNYFMTGNVTATTISSSSTPVKVAGTTTSGAITQRFTNTNNRATYTGAIDRTFKAEAFGALISGNNKVLGMFIAKNGTVIAQSIGVSTSNAGGRAESLYCAATIDLVTSDFIEVFVENQSDTTNITVENLNLDVIRVP